MDCFDQGIHGTLLWVGLGFGGLVLLSAASAAAIVFLCLCCPLCLGQRAFRIGLRCGWRGSGWCDSGVECCASAFIVMSSFRSARKIPVFECVATAVDS